MKTRKNSPSPFVFDQKIYVLGSTSFYALGTGRDSELYIKKNDTKKLSLFEFYDPELDEWTLLPSPLLRNDPPTEWVGHAVLGERRKVLFLDHRSHLHCFDLQKLVRINYSSFQAFPTPTLMPSIEGGLSLWTIPFMD